MLHIVCVVACCNCKLRYANQSFVSRAFSHVSCFECSLESAYIFHMRWIVDGYNVILADNRLAKLLRNDSETARAEFLSEIQRSGKLGKQKVTVVFDGKFSSSAERIANNIDVRFSARGETADDLIKIEVGTSAKRRSLSIVTNDHAIINYARECGANVVKSQDFLLMVRGANVTTQAGKISVVEKPEPTGNPDPELLKLFSEKKK